MKARGRLAEMIAGAALMTLTLPAAVHAHHPAGGTGLGQAGPIRTMSAETMKRGTIALDVHTEVIRFERFSDIRLHELAERGHDVHSMDRVVHTSLGIGFGVTDDLTVSLRLPYICLDNIREVHADEPDEIHSHGDAHGIGDLIVSGQYRFFRSGDAAGAAIVGLKMPTGRTNDRDREGEVFEAEFQPGSGAWSPMLGISGTKRFGKLALDANLLYTFTTDGTQETNLGDIFTYNVALSYRGGAEKVTVDMILELNGEWKGKEKTRGVRDRNSGGNVILLSPGVRLGIGPWTAYLSLGFPVVEDLNGVQNSTSYRAVFGAGMRF